MIYKQRTIPESLMGQEALLRRLNPAHPKFLKLQKDYYNSQAGYGGEKDFDYQMREFRPGYPHAILQDVYLHQDHTHFQIDSLLITPGSIVIFEVKNVAGKLRITQNPAQFIKEEANGQRVVMKSPIEELERKKYFLKQWLQQQNIDLPIIEFVVLAYQNELVIENMATDKVAFSYEIPNRLRKLDTTKAVLTGSEIQQLAYEINRQHRNYNPFPLNTKYEVSLQDILPGVYCTACQQMRMSWLAKTWRCSQCGHHDSRAHFPALHDWFCIMGPHITNRELRQYLDITNRHTARRLLVTPNTRVTGSGHKALHHISAEILNVKTLSKE